MFRILSKNALLNTQKVVLQSAVSRYQCRWMSTAHGKPRIVVLGSGWASVQFMNDIDYKLYDVHIVSPRDHFVFTPFLSAASTGAVDLRSISEPVRKTSKRFDSFTFHQAEVIDIDLQAKSVLCTSKFKDQADYNTEGDVVYTLEYHVLIIAVGCDVNTFGIPGVEEYANVMLDVNDAHTIRQKIIGCFQRAQTLGLMEGAPSSQLHFVVVGAGATGVEGAADIGKALRDLKRLYHVSNTKVTLIDANPKPKTLGGRLHRHTWALKRLVASGEAEIRTGVTVKEINSSGVVLGDETLLPCNFVLWSAGLTGRPFVKRSELMKDSRGLIVVNRYMSSNYEHVYAIGDCAAIEDYPLEQTAVVAQQQGRFLARGLNNTIRGTYGKPFAYKPFDFEIFCRSYRPIVMTVIDSAKSLLFGRNLTTH